MGKRLDWSAHKNRKRRRPLLTAGERRDNKLKARQLAERVRRGRKSPQVRRHGPVRQCSAEEVAAWAKAHGYPVASRSPAPDTSPPW